MSASTYVIVDDPHWRFDPDSTFEALSRAYPEKSLRRGSGGRRVRADGWHDSWEICVSADGVAFIIQAPGTPHMQMVSWVRGFVPSHVTLKIFDDELTIDPTTLRPGITSEQVRAEFFPEAWKVEQMSATEPPSREERMREQKPPHLA